MFEEMLTPQIEVTCERGFGLLRDRFSNKYKNIKLAARHIPNVPNQSHR